MTLDRSLLASADKLSQARDRVVAVSDMRDIDEKRLRRYGVLSGTVDEAKVTEIQRVNGVKAVDLDELRHAI